MRLLTAIAAAISAFLLKSSLAGDHLPGCGPESGCDEVLGSRWGYWLGVPVSLGALAVYALVFAASFSLGPARALSTRRTAWRILTLAAILIPGTALWFVGVQWIGLHRFCPYCMTAHVCGILIAGLIFARVPRLLAANRKARELPVLSRADLKAVWVGGLVGIGVLIAGQVLHQPVTLEIRGSTRASSPAVVPASTPMSTGAQAPAVVPAVALPVKTGTVAPARRELELHQGAFRLDLGSVPLLGRADAPDVIVSLFDYTCSHCRQLHGPLMEALRGRSNELAIVSLPVPLDPHCNPLMKRPSPEQTNGCFYARLGLGVWRAAPTKLREFDDWLFSFPRPPGTNETRARAESLVGTNALAEALRDPWIEDLLQTDIRLYHTNYLVYGRSRLPQLLIGTNLVSGLPRGPEDLYRLLPARQ